MHAIAHFLSGLIIVLGAATPLGSLAQSHNHQDEANAPAMQCPMMGNMDHGSKMDDTAPMKCPMKAAAHMHDSMMGNLEHGKMGDSTMRHPMMAATHTQKSSMDSTGHGKTSSASDTKEPAIGGLVKKVDPQAGRITIAHEEIRHMDMPGMTMVFTVRDKHLLSDVKPGQQIRFTLVREGGKMVITSISPSP